MVFYCGFDEPGQQTTGLEERSADLMGRGSQMRYVGHSIAMAMTLLCLLMGSFGQATEAAQRSSSPVIQAGRGLAGFVIADLDGDEIPDYATVDVDQSHIRLTNYSIHLKLSRGLESAIGITAPSGGLQLSSKDVNGDNILDVVVRTTFDLNLVAVLINDGNGNFSLAEPEFFPGLQHEADLHFNAETVRIPEQILMLPSRSPMSEQAEYAEKSRLKFAAESLSAEQPQDFCNFSYQSEFGRSPPEHQ
jgi:hypothetical protein